MPRAEVWRAMVLSIGMAAPAEGGHGCAQDGLGICPERGDAGLHGDEPSRCPVQLLDDVGRVHIVRAKVVGDGVQRVDRRIVVVPPSPHLAGELHGRRAIDDDEPCAAFDALIGQLQKASDEVRERHIQLRGERLGAGDLPLGHAHVDLLGVSLHRVGRASFRVLTRRLCRHPRGAGDPPQRS